VMQFLDKKMGKWVSESSIDFINWIVYTQFRDSC